MDPAGRHQLREISPEKLRRLYAHTLQRRSGLRIVLLANNPDLDSDRRLIEAGEERGHELQVLNIRQCYIRLDPRNPEVH